MNKCGDCKYWIGGGDWGLSCSKDYYIATTDPNREACDRFELSEDLGDDGGATYVLTPSYILYDLLSGDAGFDIGGWKPWLWDSIYNELMNRLEKAGYIGKVGE